jgi:hypothetical protein
MGNFKEIAVSKEYVYINYFYHTLEKVRITKKFSLFNSLFPRS